MPVNVRVLLSVRTFPEAGEKPVTVLAAMAPVPIAASDPVLSIWTPFAVPLAVNVTGFAADVPTVWTSKREPVPVLPVVSRMLKRFVVEVFPWMVHVLVNVPVLMAMFPDGFASADQSVEALPAQAPNTGAPPLADVRQSVPAPPVAVAIRFPVASRYTAPLVPPLVTLPAPPPPPPEMVWATASAEQSKK